MAGTARGLSGLRPSGPGDGGDQETAWLLSWLFFLTVERIVEPGCDIVPRSQEKEACGGRIRSRIALRPESLVNELVKEQDAAAAPEDSKPEGFHLLELDEPLREGEDDEEEEEKDDLVQD